MKHSIFYFIALLCVPFCTFSCSDDNDDNFQDLQNQYDFIGVDFKQAPYWYNDNDVLIETQALNQSGVDFIAANQRSGKDLYDSTANLCIHYYKDRPNDTVITGYNYHYRGTIYTYNDSSEFNFSQEMKANNYKELYLYTKIHPTMPDNLILSDVQKYYHSLPSSQEYNAEYKKTNEERAIERFRCYIENSSYTHICVRESFNKSLDSTEHFQYQSTNQTFNAKISSTPRIVANQPLFGQPVGEDLSEHFEIVLPSLAIMSKNSFACAYPFKMDYESEHFALRWLYSDTPRKISIKDYFRVDDWLAERIIFHMADIPEETYPEVTFTITIPTVIVDYVTSTWKEITEGTQFRNTITKDHQIVTSCTVKLQQ